jgi:diaminopimelate decarboxylase
MAFAYRDGMLHAEQVPLDEIARRFGTPCYVYSRAAISAAYREFDEALRGRDALVCYSVKANSNLAVLALLARLGAGFDIVSGGELARVIAAGGDPRKTLFSGVGKREDEIELALNSGIGCLNVESEAELSRVAAVARRIGKRAPIALRVNPDIDAGRTRISPLVCARRNSASPMTRRSCSTAVRRQSPISMWSASAATSARS